MLSQPSMSNGLVTIEVDTASATFSLTNADGLSTTGLGRLVDGGDEGDTYNYSPPAFDSVVDWPDSCTVMAIERGPLRGALLMTARYHWPECIEDGERIRGRDVTVETLIELHAGERFARVTVELDNQCLDHRLRVWFPLPIPAMSSAGSVRVRRRRARSDRGGRTHRGRDSHVPVPTVRRRGGSHDRARGPRRVRAGRRPRRRCASPRSDAVALDRLPVSWPDGDARAASGSDHRNERLAGARPPHVAVCDRAR